MNRWVSGALRVEVIGECVGEWVAVNCIRLWCSIRLGRPSLRLWLGAGVMMGLAILGWGWLVRLVGRRLLRVLVGAVVGLGR